MAHERKGFLLSANRRNAEGHRGGCPSEDLPNNPDNKGEEGKIREKHSKQTLETYGRKTVGKDECQKDKC